MTPVRTSLWAPDHREIGADEREAFDTVYRMLCWQHGWEKVMAGGGQALDELDGKQNKAKS